MRAIRVNEFGGPEVLAIETVAEPEPGANQVLVDVRVAGVAYGDVIVRSGLFPVPLPWIPGGEVGGVVVGVGPGVDESLLGRTVVSTTAGYAGGYAQCAVSEVDGTFVVPDGLDLEVALTVFGAGALARGLLSALRLQPEDTVLVTAAAGRVGSLLVQLAKSAGAGVIGAAGAGKLAAVREFGADHAVDYGGADWPERVRELTGGRGASVVLDAVGGQVGEGAVAAAADGAGRVGLYGYACGVWPTVDLPTVLRRGLVLCGPLGMVAQKPGADRRADAGYVLAAAARGELRSRIHARYPLERVQEAHRELAGRRSVGAILLTM